MRTGDVAQDFERGGDSRSAPVTPGGIFKEGIAELLARKVKPGELTLRGIEIDRIPIRLGENFGMHRETEKGAVTDSLSRYDTLWEVQNSTTAAACQKG